MKIIRIAIFVLLTMLITAPVYAEWIYRNKTDPMTDDKIVVAMILGTDDKGQSAALIFRERAQDGLGIMFIVDNGIILGNSAYIRFDDNKPEVLFARSKPSSKGVYNTVLLYPTTSDSDIMDLLIKTHNAKRVLVQVGLYGAGSGVYEFDPAGFDFNKFIDKAP